MKRFDARSKWKAAAKAALKSTTHFHALVFHCILTVYLRACVSFHTVKILVLRNYFTPRTFNCHPAPAITRSQTYHTTCATITGPWDLVKEKFTVKRIIGKKATPRGQYLQLMGNIGLIHDSVFKQKAVYLLYLHSS